MNKQHETIHRQAMPYLELILPDRCPDGVVEGNLYLARNPNSHSSYLGSLQVNLINAHWHDDLGASGEDLFSLIQNISPATRQEAVELIHSITKKYGDYNVR